MKSLINKVKRLVRLSLAQLPTKLPQGVQEFDSWANEILDLYNMPNNESTKYTLAIMILGVKPTVSHVSKAYFGRTLIKAAANQVASFVMHDVKTRSDEKKQQVAAASEVTALSVTSNAAQ